MMCQSLVGAPVTLAQTSSRTCSVARSFVSHDQPQLELVWPYPSLGLVEEEQVVTGLHEAVLEEKLSDRYQILIPTHLPDPSDPERPGLARPAQGFLLVLPHYKLVEEPAQIH
jgi:hypothetical protein